MKTLYLDLFSGISGDMFLGALIDLGVDAGRLEGELEKLHLGGYHLHVTRRQKSAIEGVKFDVHLSDDHGHGHAHAGEPALHGHDHGHGHHHRQHPHERHHHAHEHGEQSHRHGGGHEHGRSFAQIKQLISRSPLSEWVKGKSLEVFHRIAVAEGRIHGVPPEQVHFHEVGAVDSIIDVVGAAIALEMLGKPRVMASPVVEGFGWVKCAHGRFPIPAPATLAILGARRIAVSQCDEPHELVTPTGAALLAEFVEEFGPMRNLVAERIGFGLGTRDNQTRPNVLRAILASEPEGKGNDWERDTVVVLETDLDDVSGEVMGYLVQKLLDAGALDIFHTPIQMKKNRPAVLLTVLSPEEKADSLTEMMLRETTAFGVRRHLAERRKLRREFVTVRTIHGEVTVKLGRLNGVVVQAAPEYESCRKIAEEGGVPLKEVYAAALKGLEIEK